MTKHLPWLMAWLLLTAASLTLGTNIQSLKPPPTPADFMEDAWQFRQGAETITILFTGDVMLDRYVETLRGRALADDDESNNDFPFTHMPEILEEMKAELKANDLDLVVGNLEGPITNSHYQNDGTAMIFNFAPSTVELLKKAGFTTFSMANNHTLDMGEDGPRQTHDYLAAAGIEAFGHPDTSNGPYSYVTYEFAGTTLGFLGLNDAVIRLDTEAAIAKIRELDPQVDFLIIGAHWGWEYEPTARESVVEKAHAFVNAGADFIWGHHPHVIQNTEIYNGVPIYYSLGNFIFDQYFSDEVREGLVVGLKLQNGELTTAELVVDLVDGAAPKPRLE